MVAFHVIMQTTTTIGHEEWQVNGTRVIGAGDLARLVGQVGIDPFLDQLIERLEQALHRHDEEITTTFDRAGFHYRKPDLGLLEWMPAMEVGRRVVIKTVGYHPTNPVQRALPSVLATTALYDTSSGRLLAVCEATVLTALRTGAASAIATRRLASDGPITLGVVGCGAQAVAQVHAISRVREVERVIATDTDPEVAATLAGRLAFTGVEVEVVDPGAVERILAVADVICTCTSVDPGAGPVLPDGDHHPWLHVNAVGADFAEKVELPVELLRRSLVVPDVRSQCRAEGECQQLADDEIGPDLAVLVRDEAAAAAARSRTTVFDSTGWSLEDLVALELALEHAEALDLGVVVDLQAAAPDPYDPYGVLRAAMSA